MFIRQSLYVLLLNNIITTFTSAAAAATDVCLSLVWGEFVSRYNRGVSRKPFASVTTNDDDDDNANGGCSNDQEDRESEHLCQKKGESAGKGERDIKDGATNAGNCLTLVIFCLDEYGRIVVETLLLLRLLLWLRRRRRTLLLGVLLLLLLGRRLRLLLLLLSRMRGLHACHPADGGDSTAGVDHGTDGMMREERERIGDVCLFRR